jgi:transcription elongation factor GreA
VTTTNDNVAWLTQEAFDQVKAELDQLSTEGRSEIAKRIEAARAEGDLSENGGYHAAKEEQGKMEARIRQLKQLLDNAKVGTPPVDEGVKPGLVVGVEMFGDQDTYLLGSREDEHPEHEVLSADSPIGQAIMDARIGETRTATLPNGNEVEVTIRSITAP